MKLENAALRRFEVDFNGYLFYVEAANERQARYRAWKNWRYDPSLFKPPFKDFLTARVIEWKYAFAPSWAR